MKASMKPCERVLASLNHQEPDRVPVDLAQASGDSITATAYKNLLEYLQMGDQPVRISAKRGQSAQVGESVLRRFGVDFRKIRSGGPDRWQDIVLPDDSYQDEWGIIRKRPSGGVGYDVTYSPFAEDGSLSALDRHEWPDPTDPGRFRGLRDQALRMREETDFAIVVDVNCACFIRAAEMRGYENFFMDLVVNPEYAGALMDRMLDVKLAIAGRTLEEVGDLIDVVVVAGDDLGTNTGPLISPALYRSMIKPRHKRVFDFVRARTGAKRFFHCDGAIRLFMDDLIEVGVEILNPIQVSCEGMGDTRELKDRYGSRLTFWGGIDTRYVLPRGSQDDVRREVQRRLTDLGSGGGYVLCQVQNILPEVPPENIVAMFDAAHEFGRYPIADLV
ncbi:MAG: uroporphyrinogen decarboxylase family protein [Chloroflexota bacterium]